MIPSLLLLFPCSHTIFYKFQVYCFHSVFEKDCVLPQHPEWVSSDSLISVLSSLLLELYLSPGHLERAERDEDWLPPNCSEPQVRRISECRCSISVSVFFSCAEEDRLWHIPNTAYHFQTALTGAYILLLGTTEVHRLNWSVPSMSLWVTH